MIFHTRRGTIKVTIQPLPAGDFALLCFDTAPSAPSTPILWSNVNSPSFESLLRYALHAADLHLRHFNPDVHATLSPLPKEWLTFTGTDALNIHTIQPIENRIA